MLQDLSERIKGKLPGFIYDKDVDETTPLGDTIILTAIALSGAAFLSTFLPFSIGMFITYTIIVYLASVLNQRYRAAERGRKKNE